MPHLDEGTLQAWLDRPRSGLDPAEEVRIERHLSSCDPCARRLEELDGTSRSVEALLSRREPASASIPTWETVLARADRRGTAGRRGRAWRATAWAASVAAAVGVGWIANDLHRGGDLARASGDRSAVESSAGAAAPVVADAEPVMDTSPRGAAATGPARDSAPAVLAAAQPAAEPAPEPAEEAADEVVDVPERVVAEAAPDVTTDPTAAAPAVVRGRVTDEAGRPLESVQVVAEGTGRGVLTDRDGSFELSLDALAADSGRRDVTLTAQLIGYRKERRALSMGAGDSVSTDFLLAGEALALDELVVTGSVGERSAEGAGRADAAPAAPARMAVPDAWRTVDRSEAEAEAGFRLLSIPDLRVVRIDVAAAGDVRSVRIVQQLEEGGTLELIETRGEVFVPAPGGDAGSDGRSRAVVRRGEVTVAATAPRSPEALRALLERLR